MDLSTFQLLSIGLDAWLTSGVLLVILVGLVSGKFGADLIMLSGLATLLIGGVLDTREAVAGFANPAVLTVGFLYIVAAGLRETGAFSMLTKRLLGRPKNLLVAQARLMIPVAGASAFVNNTPIVAMFLPVLSDWARRNNLSPSRLFMPLSFAAILGGMCTLVGTSTNLVINELLLEQIALNDPDDKTLHVESFGMFTLARVGLPAAILGIGFMLIFGRRFLKDRESRRPRPEHPREYMVAMRVEPGSAIVGKSVEDAGLRQLTGLFLSRIDRREQSILAVTPEHLIEGEDVLVFVGLLDSVVDLQRIKGLSPMTGDAGKDAAPRHAARLIEAVVSHASPLLGKSIREGAFRSRYDAVVIAVHRNGARLRNKIGDIRLRAGDTLLLEARPGFDDRHGDSNDFYLVNERPGAAAPRYKLARLSLAILGLMVVFISIRPEMAMTIALAAALAMILTRCCTGPQARASVDFQVLVTIGSAFGLGAAMHNSGLAASIAGGLVDWATPIGLWATLAVIYLITAIFTSLISNNAAAVLVFPIALEAARSSGQPLLPFAATVAIAASAGFATPLGYQTNLMVMGPGGYKTTDFLRFGIPITLICGIVTILLAPHVF